MNHKISTVVLLLMALIVIIAILVAGLDIGDEVEECGPNEYIKNVGGIWSCYNITDDQTTDPNIQLMYMSNAPCKQITFNFNNIDRDKYVYKVHKLTTQELRCNLT